VHIHMASIDHIRSLLLTGNIGIGQGAIYHVPHIRDVAERLVQAIICNRHLEVGSGSVSV
jgi:hypothetical protein